MILQCYALIIKSIWNEMYINDFTVIVAGGYGVAYERN